MQADGKYVVGPGSANQRGAPYVLANDADIADAPEWLLDLLRPAEEANRASNDKLTGDPERIARALDVIPNDEPRLGQLEQSGLGDMGPPARAKASMRSMNGRRSPTNTIRLRHASVGRPSPGARPAI